MTTTFITGANKSLGLETARRLVEAGHTVLLGARHRERGRAAAESLGARFVQIDVTDDASVQAAAADVAAHEGTIDALVNSAGVLGKVGPVEEYTAADVSAVLDVNVVGIVRVTHAFLPLLRKSPNPVIVNVSSGMGSFSMTQAARRRGSARRVPGGSVRVACPSWHVPDPLRPRGHLREAVAVGPHAGCPWRDAAPSAPARTAR
ncbi:SDR family NAD(P)-dependent oxidoreductase [Streptomyces sp. NPDC021225]|uniref:SDR family NAD(P)-dependent oxidoreductase n=1 Tax=Streptomyces sp. NPDC021225 TaxID=3365121 RepID=UPI0037B363E6